jgi:predicted ATP-dependent endonuclease of OLD family
MSLTFSKIYIKEEIFKDYKIEDNSEFISNLSRINFFIGANNSGKSRFLRSLFESKNLKFQSYNLDLEKLNDPIRKFNEQIDKIIEENILNDPHNESSRWKTVLPLRYTYTDLNLDNLIIDNLKTIVKSNTNINFNIKENYFNDRGHGLRNSHERIESLVKEKARICLSETSLITKDLPKIIPKYNKQYIPILRGLRTLKTGGKSTDIESAKNFYLERTCNDYFKGITGLEDNISTGQDIYEEVKTLLLSARRGKIKDFELFLSSSFFNNKEVNLVPHIDDDSLHIKIGQEEYPIYHLGDGIQAIITITYPLFFNEKENLKVFIEEPELNLHPGLQRILIETLLRPEFKDYQYFITTHSNHFLDITLDLEKISVYTFQKESSEKESKFVITNVENDDSEVLSLIGVKNSSVFLSNCTIWVEGITDRIYLRKYLELIQQSEIKKFKEDTHYSFVEYGGNNITHWSFLDSDDADHENINVERLCSKLMLITDNDGAGQDANGKPQKKKEKKFARFQQLKEKLGERYFLLSVREIENLLTKETIQKVVAENEKNTALDFSKFDGEKYKQQPLGKYINDKVSGKQKDYASDSGSIKDKVSFAKKAVAKMKSANDLSEEANALAKKVYDFIKEQNQ